MYGMRMPLNISKNSEANGNRFKQISFYMYRFMYIDLFGSFVIIVDIVLDLIVHNADGSLT